MLTPELRTYLENIEGASSVPSDDAIKEALFSAGWNDESIRDAVSYITLIKQKKDRKLDNGESKLIPVVNDVSFIGEEGAKEKVPVANPSQTPVSSGLPPSLSSALPNAFNGKSSQSVLYPDNSSRLGLRDGNDAPFRIQSVPPVVPAEKIPDVPISNKPPLVDIAEMAESVPSEMVEDRVQSEGQLSEDMSQGGSRLDTKGTTPLVPRIPQTRPVVSQYNRVTPAARQIDGVRVPQSPASFAAVQQKVTMQQTVSPPVLSPEEKSVQHAPLSSISQEVPHNRSARFVRRVGFIAVLFGVCAALGYAYVARIGPFASVKGPYGEHTFATDFLKGLSQMKSGVATAHYQAGIVSPTEGAEPFPVTVSTSSLSMIPFLPNEDSLSETTVSLSISTTFDRTQQKTNDFQFSVEGSYAVGSLALSGAIDVLGVDGSLYARLGKAPNVPVITMFLGDITKIEGKWISLSSSTTAESSIERYVSRGSSMSATTTAAVRLITRTLVEAIDDEGVLSVTSKERISSWKGDATRYHLAVSFEKMAPMLRRVLNQILTKQQDVPASYITKINDVIARLESKEDAQLLAYLSKHMVVTVDVADDGIPLAVSQSIQVLLPQRNESVDQKAFESAFSFSFADTNKPITLRAPDDAIVISEVARLLMNLDEDEYKTSLQFTRINAVAQAVETFQKLTGRLPKNLDELTLSARTVLSEGVPANADAAVSFLWLEYQDRPFLPNIPIDVFTQKPFEYTVSNKGGSYALVYMMTLPKELRSEALRQYSDWSYELGGADGKTPKWRVVSGKNTLTETYFSVEGKIRRK